MQKFKAGFRLAFLFLSLAAATAEAYPVTVFTADTTSGSLNSLVVGPDGALYAGSSNGVVRVTTAGVSSMLASFTPGPDRIIAGHDGYLYGTIRTGGAFGKGSVFRLSPSGVLTTLVSFDGTIGDSPRDLLQGADGNLYGNMSGGQFKLTTAGVLTKRASAGLDNLAEGLGGNLFGTIVVCDDGFCGSHHSVVERVTPAGATTSTATIAGTDGQAWTALTLGADGGLYGVTTGNFEAGCGTCEIYTGGIYRLDPDGTNYRQLAQFSFGNGSTTPLLQAVDGSFFTSSWAMFTAQLNRLKQDPGPLGGWTMTVLADEYFSDGFVQTSDGNIFSFRPGGIDRLKRPTTLSANGTYSVDLTTHTIRINPSARLTDDMSGGRPVVGQTIVFGRNGHTICSARTNKDGIAFCRVSVKERVLETTGFNAHYAESDVYAGADDHSQFVACIGCP